MTSAAAASGGGAEGGGGGSSRPDRDSLSSLPKPAAAVVTGSDDALFGHIERSQRESCRPFGTLLDAGTGSHSLRWIASLLKDHPTRGTRSTRTGTAGGEDHVDDDGNNEDDDGNDEDDPLFVSRYCAVTADETMRRNVQDEAIGLGIDGKGEVVIGNWAEGFDESERVGTTSSSINVQDGGGGGRHLCRGEMYDTILADYLVGAIDGFSPYYQDRIFPRLASHLKPGGRMYVVGLNPIPDRVPGAPDVFCRVTKLRDACILLAGHRCYREYPPDWIERHLRLAGLNVVGQSRFPIMYSHATIVRQLNVARSKLSLFPSKSLAKEMGRAIDALEEESREATGRSPTGRLRLGFDYVITAEMPGSGAAADGDGDGAAAVVNGVTGLNIG